MMDLVQRLCQSLLARFGRIGAWLLLPLAVLGTVVVVECGRIPSLLSATRLPTPVHFDQGLTAFDPEDVKPWTNVKCGKCHAREFEDWRSSQHAAAATNENFKVEYLYTGGDGRAQQCMNCHAPINPYGHLLPTQEAEGIEQVFKAPPPWLADGVDCLSCHLRDGKVLGVHVTSRGLAAHPMRKTPELSTAAFCAGCHQFGFKTANLPDNYHGQLQQASLAEFLDYRKAGGAEQSCHDCHLNDHRMEGGYTDSVLKTALELELGAVWQPESRQLEIVVTLSTQNVGHRVPGGELFRFLTLSTQVTDARGRPLLPRAPVGSSEELAVPEASSRWPKRETMRRRIGEYEHGMKSKAPPAPDTRLFPDSRRRFVYHFQIADPDLVVPVRVRSELWYHLLAREKAREIGHTSDFPLKRLLLTRTVSPDISP
ncbi:MAG: multiheme c-type cytochrome [Planctomycetaceae bacterium]